MFYKLRLRAAPTTDKMLATKRIIEVTSASRGFGHYHLTCSFLSASLDDDDMQLDPCGVTQSSRD